MKEVQFSIYFCGMSDKTFTDQIMIYQPNSRITLAYPAEDLHQLKILRVSELVDDVKARDTVSESLGSWGMENLSYLTVYVRYKDYLLGLREDKTLSDLFRELNLDQLEFAFFVVGGASIHNETSYRFTVHSDERIHEHMPHVHVSKAGVDVRYSLETLMPIDPLVNPHRRDHKKTIVPFLKKNQARLLELWQHNVRGYRTPELAENGNQFYPES